VLPKIVDDLRNLIGLKHDSIEEERVNTVLKPSTERVPGDWPLFARRNEDMASAILAKPKPLLVKLGDRHVVGVAILIGPGNAYRVHYPYRLPDVTFKGIG
jgi:hypothetical protein